MKSKKGEGNPTVEKIGNFVKALFSQSGLEQEVNYHWVAMSNTFTFGEVATMLPRDWDMSDTINDLQRDLIVARHWFAETPSTLPPGATFDQSAGCVCVDPDGEKVLLVDAGRKNLEIPGGTHDPKVHKFDLWEVAKDELIQETGIDLSQLNVEPMVVAMQPFPRNRLAGAVRVVYGIAVKGLSTQQHQSQDTDEIKGMFWVPINNLDTFEGNGKKARSDTQAIALAALKGTGLRSNEAGAYVGANTSE